MPSAQRGTVYRFSGGSPKLVGVLVLTNNVWNRRMNTVGVVPVRMPVSPDSIWEPVCLGEPRLQARVGYLTSRPRERLEEAIFTLSHDQVAQIGAALADLLAIRDLTADPASVPVAPSGTINYPRWSEVYYVGPPIVGQIKRYVVVSRDHWNAASGSAITVRTTSQQKNWGAAFPPIEAGAARACCGDATALPRPRFDFVRRPSPAVLDFDDMVNVARGLADVFDFDSR